jgi:hypothetical protein
MFLLLAVLPGNRIRLLPRLVIPNEQWGRQMGRTRFERKRKKP